MLLLLNEFEWEQASSLLSSKFQTYYLFNQRSSRSFSKPALWQETAPGELWLICLYKRSTNWEQPIFCFSTDTFQRDEERPFPSASLLEQSTRLHCGRGWHTVMANITKKAESIYRFSCFPWLAALLCSALSCLRVQVWDLSQECAGCEHKDRFEFKVWVFM